MLTIPTMPAATMALTLGEILSFLQCLFASSPRALS
jgi:hypothetical protein